jgi:hypothetical protein
MSDPNSEVSTGKIGNIMEAIGIGKDFFNRTPELSN